jgi:putative FmdB family regulatory protein
VPTYQYACTDCAERLEVVQKFSDDPLTVCAACGGRLRKVYSPVGIVFKGSGFYRNDSRADRKRADSKPASANGTDSKKADSSSSSDSSGSSGSSSDKSGTSGDKKADKPASSSAQASPGSKVA